MKKQLKVGDVLVAINEGRLPALSTSRGRAALVIGKEYKICRIDEEDFEIQSEIGAAHCFDISEFRDFFRIPTEAPTDEADIQVGDVLIAINEGRTTPNNERTLTIGKGYEILGFAEHDEAEHFVIISDLGDEHYFPTGRLGEFFKSKNIDSAYKKGKSVIFMTHQVLGLTEPGVFVQHRDKDGFNCMRENLRFKITPDHAWANVEERAVRYEE